MSCTFLPPCACPLAPANLLAPKIPRTRPSFPCRLSMEKQQLIRGSKLMEFPYLTDPHRDTMVDLISAMENRLGSHHLLPSSVPPDVEHYQNENGTSQGTLHIRCGIDSSPVCTVSSRSPHINVHACLLKRMTWFFFFFLIISSLFSFTEKLYVYMLIDFKALIKIFKA